MIVHVSAKMKTLNCWSGLPIWLFWSQNLKHLWLFLEIKKPDKIWLFWSQNLKHLWLFLEIKKPDKIWLFLAFFQSKRLSSGKILSELHIHYKSFLTRVYDDAGYKKYCKDFAVALKIIDVIYKTNVRQCNYWERICFERLELYYNCSDVSDEF